MLPRNLMEEKQLDFNQPFLSVRRFSSTPVSGKDDKRKTNSAPPSIPPLASYKSELKSGPVRNPGTIPFLWEKTPGRPKDDDKRQIQSLEQSPSTPKLPPGRILKIKKEAPKKVLEDPCGTSCQAGKVPSSIRSAASVDENVKQFENSKDAVVEESSNSEDDDEAYLDALDTLSRAESSLLNCSLSGLSGPNDPDVKPSGTFSDPQTRDFMMGRFLPAAKAMASEMASETPQYASRKHTVAWEQPRQVKNILSRDKKPPIPRHKPEIFPYYAKDKMSEGSDDEEDYVEPRNVPAKICGLLPQFCLKSSFCLMNPVPGMSVRTRLPVGARRMQARSPPSISCSRPDNTHNGVGNFDQILRGGPQAAAKLHEGKCMSRNKSNQITYPGSSQKLEGSSLYKRLQGSGTSTTSNESPHSPFYEEKKSIDIPEEAKNDGVSGFSSHKKGPTSFRELLADQSEIGLASPMVEKTLYIDSVHNVQLPNLDCCSSEMKGLPNGGENDLGRVGKIMGIEEITFVDSAVKVTEDLNIADQEALLDSIILKPVGSNLLPFSNNAEPKSGMNAQKSFGYDQDLFQVSVTPGNSTLPNNKSLAVEVQQLQDVENIENSHGSYSQFHLPPPLPKSPSESWLFRTLPSLSSKNPSVGSYFGTRINPGNHTAKLSSVDSRWETIVKTSKVKQQHLEFSETLKPTSEP